VILAFVLEGAAPVERSSRRALLGVPLVGHHIFVKTPSLAAAARRKRLLPEIAGLPPPWLRVTAARRARVLEALDRSEPR